MSDLHPPEAGASFALPVGPNAGFDADPPSVIHGPDRPAPAPPAATDAPGAPPHLPSADAEKCRRDGWTPERKRTFLERRAEGCTVDDAARAAGMSAASAYTLRARDPVFEAGWDAALLLTRPHVVDLLGARSIKGCVERIYRNGEVAAERHRYDNRLSMALLARLDARCDRAEARDDPSFRVSRRWDEFLDALGAGRGLEAAAMLAPPPAPDAVDALKTELGSQLSQLRKARRAVDGHAVWVDDAGGTWTDYPPPPGFDPTREQGWYGDDDYRRALSADEEEAFVAAGAPDPVDDLSGDLVNDPELNAQRDRFFANLRRQVAGDVADPAADAPTVTPPAPHPGSPPASPAPLPPEPSDRATDPTPRAPAPRSAGHSRMRRPNPAEP